MREKSLSCVVGQAFLRPTKSDLHFVTALSSGAQEGAQRSKVGAGNISLALDEPSTTSRSAFLYVESEETFHTDVLDGPCTLFKQGELASGPWRTLYDSADTQ